jgi:hypothetical protein
MHLNKKYVKDIIKNNSLSFLDVLVWKKTDESLDLNLHVTCKSSSITKKGSSISTNWRGQGHL